MGFQLKKDKVKIPFKFVNNLILIPLKINGNEMTFLLDSGASETVLYSKRNLRKEVFGEIKRTKFVGMGETGPIYGLQSVKNTVSVSDDFIDENHILYIIFSDDFEFLNYLNLPINGIIGYHFFKDHPIEINYIHKYLTIYKNKDLIKPKNKIAKELPISIDYGQPYLETKVTIKAEEKTLKLLLDLGNTDAIWLFPLLIKDFKQNKPNIQDVLGHGPHGIIKGTKSRIKAVHFGNHKISKPILATPDDTSLSSLKIAPNRKGSIGNEILRRFRLIFDYPNQKLYFRKNKNFKYPFITNKSGLQIRHSGLIWDENSIDLMMFETGSSDSINTSENGTYAYNYQLNPLYKISDCRQTAPCAKAGLKREDQIISINRKKTKDLSLKEIEQYFYKRDGLLINMKVKRGKDTLNFRFRLKDPIPYKS